ncbi:hypothetical protein ACTFIV_007768 [Dictyostelium citrinum]
MLKKENLLNNHLFIFIISIGRPFYTTIIQRFIADGAIKELLGNETISLEKIIERRYVFYRCFMTFAIFKTFFKDNNQPFEINEIKFLLNSRFRRFEKKIPVKVRRDFYCIHKLLDIEHIHKQSENKINKLYLCREAQRNKFIL